MYKLFRFLFGVLVKASIVVTVTRGQAEKQASGLQSFRRVCYFTNWSCDLLVREAHFCLRHIDVNLCTHIVYAFAGINVTSLSLSPTRLDDENRGEIKGRYVLFNDLKKRDRRLKTLLSVGGSYQTEMFVKVSTSAAARSQFAYNSAFYVRKWGFDGLDLDWEYPHESHKEALTLLIQDLRLAFMEEAELSGGPELILSLAAPASDEKVKAGYDVNVISQHVDMINLMAYDFYGAWGRITGFNSPLYPRASDTRISHKHCVEWSVNLWLHLGAPANKINLGIAAYGQSFTLDTKKGEAALFNISSTGDRNYLPASVTKNTTRETTMCNETNCVSLLDTTARFVDRQQSLNGTARDQTSDDVLAANDKVHDVNADPQAVGVGAKSIGPGRPGRLRHFNGQLSYPEICENSLLGKGMMFWDDEQQVPYVTYDDQWIGFDDVRSVAVKVKWAVRHRLGGVMFWSLDLDDFTGQYCGEGRFPLLTAVHNTLTCLIDGAEDNETTSGTSDTYGGDCLGHASDVRNGSKVNLSLFELLLTQSLDASGGSTGDYSRTRVGNSTLAPFSSTTKGNGTRHSGSRGGSILIDKLRPTSSPSSAKGRNREDNSTSPRSDIMRDAGGEKSRPRDDQVTQGGGQSGQRHHGPNRHPQTNGDGVPHHRRRSGLNNSSSDRYPPEEPTEIPAGDRAEDDKSLDSLPDMDAIDYDDQDNKNDFANNYYYYIAFKADRTPSPDVSATTVKQPATLKATTKSTTKSTTRTTSKTRATTTTSSTTTGIVRTTSGVKKHVHKDKQGIPAHLRRNLTGKIQSNFGSILVLFFISFFTVVF